VLHHGKSGVNEHICGGEIARPLKIFFLWTSFILKEVFLLHTRLSTRSITRLALLVSMSIILKSFMSLETGVFRFSFFDIPLMSLGMMFDPFSAIIAGFIVDFVHVLISPFAFTFNLMTVSTIMWALIPSLVLYRKTVTLPKIIVVVIFTSLLAFSLNSLQLYLWVGEGMFAQVPLRLITAILKMPLQVMALHVLYHRVLVHSFTLVKER